MKFTIEIELGNDAMKRFDSIRAAIKEALMPVRLARNARNVNVPHDGDSGKIMDVNGNSVGVWEVNDRKPAPGPSIRPAITVEPIAEYEARKAERDKADAAHIPAHTEDSD